MGLSGIREVLVNDESAFAENVTAPASNTYATRLPVLSIDSGPPEQRRGTDGSIQNRANESRPGFRLPRTGEVAFTTLWGGGGSGFTGEITEHWLMTLLGDALGGLDVTSTGSVVASATGADAVTIATGETLPVGSIVIVGAKGDTRSDGQAAVVSGYTSGTGEMDLLTALPAAPAADDVVYATALAYPTQTLSQSKRFLIGFPDTGAQYHYMGCHCSGLTFSIPMDGSDLPKIGFKYQSAYWDTTNVTVPGSVALSDIEAAPVAGGSVFCQTVGTVTRAILNPTQIDLSLDIANATEHGPYAGQAAFQTTRAIQRLRCIPTLTMTVPWSNDHRTLFNSDGPDSTHKHILVTLNTGVGRSVGFYMPRAYVIGSYPAYTDHNGLLYQTLVFQGREGPTTTNDLTRSAIRFFAA